MRKLIIIIALVATALGAFITAGVASAHHTTVECVGVGTWRLTNSEPYAEIATIVETGQVVTILPNASVDVSYDGTSLTVEGYWPKGPGPGDDVYVTNSGSGDCEIPETTTTTTQPPTTTTTTIPQQETTTTWTPTTPPPSVSTTPASSTATTAPTKPLPTSSRPAGASTTPPSTTPRTPAAMPQRLPATL